MLEKIKEGFNVQTFSGDARVPRATFRLRAGATIGMLLTLIALLAGCGGGGGGGGGGGNNGGSATVFGTVRDSANQDQGVSGATVEIGGVRATTTTVDQATADNPVGSFTLQGAAVGSTTAIVTPPGGSPQTVAFSPALASGSNGPFDLLINIGQISGRILLPNGTPASGARVFISATGESAETTSDGRFFIADIPPGATDVTAVLGTASVVRTVNVGNGVVDLGDLTLVEDPNPNPPGGPATLVGTVRLSDNSSPNVAAGITVFVLRLDGSQVEQTTTNSTGDYSFYIPLGSYRVRAFRSGYNEAIVDANITDPNNAARADITLTP